MRTTLTIDNDLMREIREVAHRKGLPLKQVVNRALRVGLRGLDAPSRKRYRCPTFSMGTLRPGLDIDKASRIAASLEDEEVVRKLEERK